ncbi:MAG: hypothetical protein K2G70_05920 [Turicibacter sp.]|nr:hypothetical protein [Turicibacter sp.]
MNKENDPNEEINSDALTDAELAEFLAEIEETDDEVEYFEKQQQTETDNIDSLVNITAEVAEGIEVEDYEDDYGSEHEEQYKALRPEVAARQFDYNARNAQRIAREALSQNKIDLYSKIPNEHLKMLISCLVQPKADVLEKYKVYINKRLSSILLRLVPRQVRSCWRHYPQSMRKSPGFLYVAPSRKGKSYTFYATPNVPVYFAQHTERVIIAEEMPDKLARMDMMIRKYHRHIGEKAKREVFFAEYLTRNKVYTYMDLLRLKPGLFELLYKTLEKLNAFPAPKHTWNRE